MIFQFDYGQIGLLFRKIEKSDIVEEIKITTEFIKLDSFLKFAGVASLGTEAKFYIQEGQVYVNGEVETRRGKKLYKDDVVEFNGETFKIV